MVNSSAATAVAKPAASSAAAALSTIFMSVSPVVLLCSVPRADGGRQDAGELRRRLPGHFHAVFGLVAGDCDDCHLRQFAVDVAVVVAKRLQVPLDHADEPEIRSAAGRGAARRDAHGAGQGRKSLDAFVDADLDRKSTRLNSSHSGEYRMPS